MKAFVYLRTSGITSDGFPRQLAACVAYAEKNGLTIARTFRDEAVSGRSDYDARPALRDLLAELGEVQTVIIEKLDRLARDLIVQEGIIQKFRENGCNLVSTMEPDLLSEDPSRVFIRQVFGAVAQLDRALVVGKLRAARERIRGSGERCEGRKPFGFHAGEREALEKMLYLHARGRSARYIAAFLNATGYRPRDSSQWWPSVVSRILARKPSLDVTPEKTEATL